VRIRELSLSPTCPTTATEITFKAEIENSGTRSSGRCTLKFKVDGETMPIYYSIPALDSGQTYTVQHNMLLGAGMDNTINLPFKRFPDFRQKRPVITMIME
jgi:hypothetical protein